VLNHAKRQKIAEFSMLKIGTAQSTHRFNLPEKGSLNGADFIFISAKKTIWLCIFLQYRTAAEWLVYRKVMDVCREGHPETPTPRCHRRGGRLGRA
jgi:hypothetical protein